MSIETTSNSPKSNKRYRAGVYDTSGNLLKIKTATSEELLKIIVDEYAALGYVIREGFVREHDGKLLWVQKGVKSREVAVKGIPVVPSTHYA